MAIFTRRMRKKYQKNTIFSTHRETIQTTNKSEKNVEPYLMAFQENGRFETHRFTNFGTFATHHILKKVHKFLFSFQRYQTSLALITSLYIFTVTCLTLYIKTYIYQIRLISSNKISTLTPH